MHIYFSATLHGNIQHRWTSLHSTNIHLVETLPLISSVRDILVWSVELSGFLDVCQDCQDCHSDGHVSQKECHHDHEDTFQVSQHDC